MGKFPCFGSTCNLYNILEFVAQDDHGKNPFDSSFIVVIITALMIQSQNSVTALKYMHFWTKFQQENFSLFVNFTPENLKYMDMTAEHGNYPLFQTKVI